MRSCFPNSQPRGKTISANVKSAAQWVRRMAAHRREQSLNFNFRCGRMRRHGAIPQAENYDIAADAKQGQYDALLHKV